LPFGGLTSQIKDIANASGGLRRPRRPTGFLEFYWVMQNEIMSQSIIKYSTLLTTPLLSRPLRECVDAITAITKFVTTNRPSVSIPDSVVPNSSEILLKIIATNTQLLRCGRKPGTVHLVSSPSETAIIGDD
jgi:hypothetical protein